MQYALISSQPFTKYLKCNRKGMFTIANPISLIRITHNKKIFLSILKAGSCV
jgi:hypothetical protein